MHFINEYGKQEGQRIDLSRYDGNGIVRLLNQQGITTATPRMTFKAREFKKTPQCVAWRQTANCNPRSSRVPTEDASCSDDIYSNQSGFCECADKTTMLFSCEEARAPFTCQEACSHPNEYRS
eukprot:TRINITY_DN5220_c0_g1_i1.p2 TRINITY_DN5220_c0_g1~~TRINITY_DN5220_c0_g1_i1.p2  ORF type:complete len:123 (+),score=7.53 TRINITY_DN5220_c0_g1_i1:453-821(+)